MIALPSHTRRCRRIMEPPAKARRVPAHSNPGMSMEPACDRPMATIRVADESNRADELHLRGYTCRELQPARLLLQGLGRGYPMDA